MFNCRIGRKFSVKEGNVDKFGHNSKSKPRVNELIEDLYRKIESLEKIILSK